MVSKGLIDEGEMRSLAHIILEVLPSYTKSSSVGDCMAYVRQVLESFEMKPHDPPVSKDI